MEQEEEHRIEEEDGGLARRIVVGEYEGEEESRHDNTFILDDSTYDQEDYVKVIEHLKAEVESLRQARIKDSILRINKLAKLTSSQVYCDLHKEKLIRELAATREDLEAYRVTLSAAQVALKTEYEQRIALEDRVRDLERDLENATSASCSTSAFTPVIGKKERNENASLNKHNNNYLLMTLDSNNSSNLGSTVVTDDASNTSPVTYVSMDSQTCWEEIVMLSARQFEPTREPVTDSTVFHQDMMMGSTTTTATTSNIIKNNGSNDGDDDDGVVDDEEDGISSSTGNNNNNNNMNSSSKNKKKKKKSGSDKVVGILNPYLELDDNDDSHKMVEILQLRHELSEKERELRDFQEYTHERVRKVEMLLETQMAELAKAKQEEVAALEQENANLRAIIADMKVAQGETNARLVAMKNELDLECDRRAEAERRCRDYEEEAQLAKTLLAFQGTTEDEMFSQHDTELQTATSSAASSGHHQLSFAEPKAFKPVYKNVAVASTTTTTTTTTTTASPLFSSPVPYSSPQLLHHQPQHQPQHHQQHNTPPQHHQQHYHQQQQQSLFPTPSSFMGSHERTRNWVASV